MKRRRNPSDWLMLTVVRAQNHPRIATLTLTRGHEFVAELFTELRFNRDLREVFPEADLDIFIEIRDEENKRATGARGWLDSRTGEIDWWKRSKMTMDTLDRFGLIVDNLLRWYFDQSMPPTGTTRAEYEVEL